MKGELEIKPLISIVIPVYNTEKYISKCIDSVINQNLKELEIIIVNDGSTDNSLSICKSYAEKDSRIILLNQSSQGVSVARNNGIDISSGEYIGFVDSDDWVEQNMFEILYNNSISYNADISMCNANCIDENGKTVLDESNNNIFMHYNIDIDTDTVFNKNDKMSICVDYDNNYLWNKIYKAYLFQNVRFPKGKIYEDISVTYKLIDKSNKIVVSPKYKYNYLKRPNSITSEQIFKINLLNIVEAYIEQYDCIVINYPNLEKTCRKRMFISLLNCLHNAYLNNCILKHKKEFNEIIEKAKTYDIYGCGLYDYQQKILRLAFEDMRKYILCIKLWSK